MGSHSNRMRHDARSYSASRLTSSSAHNTSRTSHTTGYKDPNTLELGLSARRELLSVNELPKLLDEAISEEEQLDMDLASAVCQRFLEWDLETQEASLGQVRARLAQVLGRDVDRDVDRTDEE
ncbi:hypothetical protein BJV77DRAFT_548520 [Russula vinacea]|nr:hypothetical protein BJV77DRAFT_548520 [Russula vinacea]